MTKANVRTITYKTLEQRYPYDPLVPNSPPNLPNASITNWLRHISTKNPSKGVIHKSCGHIFGNCDPSPFTTAHILIQSASFPEHFFVRINKTPESWLNHTLLPNFLRGGGIGPKGKFGRTKMKNWSKNFSRASGAQKKGFVEALKTAKKPLKTAKNR